MSPRRAHLAIAAALLLAVSSACVSPKRTGVALQNLEADVVFDRTPGPAASMAPNADVGPIPPELRGDIELEVLEDLPPIPRKRLTPLAPPAPDCPTALPTAFPDRVASFEVENPPVTGAYRWKREGTQLLTAFPGFPVKIQGFERRLVRNVVQASDNFTFDVVQTELESGQQVVVTYRVPLNPPDLPVYGPANVRGNTPDGGIAISKIERQNAKTGAPISVFQPQPAVMVLPLPVLPGEQFVGGGVDPNTLQALQVQGKVTGQERVDVCGQIVNGWNVDMTQVFGSGSASTQRTFNMVFATQYGGLPIREHLEQQTADANTSMTFTIGQKTPDPVPANAR